MARLEDKTFEAVGEAFTSLLDGISNVELNDSLQKTQFERVKKELKHLKKLYKESDTLEFSETQKWLSYSLDQISHELPPNVLLRFENLFLLLRKEGRI